MKLLSCIEKAFTARETLHDDKETNAYRLFGGPKEGIPGLVVDRYGEVAILLLYEGQWNGSQQDLKELSKFYSDRLPLKSVYVKNFVADRTRQVAGEDLYAALPFWGEAAPNSFLVRENGLSFWVRPYEGFSTGIFLDQRGNRKTLAEKMAGKKALNCFAYTCGFSVSIAAKGGETVNVDVSKKYLEWGKQNFLANGLEPDRHAFLSADTVGFLERAARRKELFDLVILDPPSFSRHKGGVFSLEKEARRLMALAWEVLAKDGFLFFSCNLAQWTSKDLRRFVEELFGASQYKGQVLPEVPVDFKKNLFQLSSVLIKKKTE